MKFKDTMSLNNLLLLGNPELYKKSTPVKKGEVKELEEVIQSLHNTLMAFRGKYKAGRAIAAPQIGIRKQLIYMYIDKPEVLINPRLENKSKEMIEVWDDCLCFPELLVRVKRYKSCTIKFYDIEFREYQWDLEGDMSELIQHEYDHLEGILATQRAIDEKSFRHRPDIYNRLI